MSTMRTSGLCLVLCAAVGVFADDQEEPAPSLDDPPADAPTQDSASQEAATGILPIPDYSGGIAERSHLLGALGGARDSLAGHGIQFYVDWTQHLQSVVDGGVTPEPSRAARSTTCSRSTSIGWA